MSYKWVSSEMFAEKMEEILEEMSGESVLAIPGVYKIVEEHFEAEILEELEAENFPNLMTYDEVKSDFEQVVLVDFPYDLDDTIALRESWNDYTDFLCTEKRITPDNYEDWDNPY